MDDQQSNRASPIDGSSKSTVIEVRKGQAPGRLDRAEFSVRFRATLIDPAFRAEDESIERLEQIAWLAYTDGRKAPFAQKAGPGYADQTMIYLPNG